MVFFRAAMAVVFSIRFSEEGFVYENESAERATLGYQLYVYFWHGNSAALSCIESGMSRARMFLHGAASLTRALGRPFGLAQVLHAVGKLLGTFGVRIEHR